MNASLFHLLRIATTSLGICLLATASLRADLVVPKAMRPPVRDAFMSRVVNDGVIAGTPEQRFVFDAYTIVSGGGHFEYTHSMGIFAPGHSPGVVSGNNTAYSGTLQIELGGTDPGFGSGRHDQINDAGTISLFSNPTLAVLSFEGFTPEPGDQFTILTWQEGLEGSFGSVVLDAQFTVNGITFEQIITNPSGAGNLTLVAVPEPSAFLYLGLVTGLVVFSISIAKKLRNLQSLKTCNL